MTCRILMSFAMENHGSAFAHWLRDRLMKTYGLYAVDEVYVDSIVSRSIAGEVNLALDTRDHMKSPTGASPIGARRDDWNTLYTTAMRAADVMLFCHTQEFANSENCRLEWTQFLREKSKPRKGKRPLRGVILEFAKCDLFGSFDTRITRVRASKQDGGRRGLAWDVGDYVLGEIEYNNLIGAIGPLSR